MKRLLPSILVIVLSLCGCENNPIHAREAGALGGAALGAGLGAIIGHQTGHAGAGVAIGSAIGALSGGLVGNEVDTQNAALDERDRRLQDQDRELQRNRELLDELRRRGADARITGRGVVVNLPDVLFEFDSARLTSDAEKTAREIAGVISRSAATRHISVEGHTDSLGTVTYNQRLSEQRAYSVANELVKNGIAHRQLSTRGYGESQPIASNKTEAGRQRNRRVEVVIENR